jgi:F-type H+-transporting ATPase subunit b
MPQLNQLAEVAYSQFFWLLVVLGLIYFGIGHFMLPKIQSTVDLRDSQIAGDLEAAQAARAAADTIEADYRARIEASRAEALKLANEAKAASGRETETKVRAAGEEIGARMEVEEGRVRAATDKALAEIESVAAEAAQDMVQRLAGVTVSSSQAAAAVKKVIHG